MRKFKTDLWLITSIFTIMSIITIVFNPSSILPILPILIPNLTISVGIPVNKYLAYKKSKKQSLLTKEDDKESLTNINLTSIKSDNNYKQFNNTNNYSFQETTNYSNDKPKVKMIKRD